jgi:transcriptional regulator with XRE-family HTH domain
MVKLEATVKNLLAQKKMSIEKLAVQSGLTKVTVLNIFKKNDAKVSQLEAMSQVLGVPIKSFFDENWNSNQTAGDAGVNVSGSRTRDINSHSQSAGVNNANMSFEARITSLTDCQKELALKDREVAMLNGVIDRLQRMIDKQ